jgi:phosphatidylserine/phosphatidylglycerophosphate/cardiolipin synthase-like enzyme
MFDEHPGCGRVNGWMGERVESAACAHHRRRLSRAGQLERLDPPQASASLWAAGDPRPRDGNDLEVLIDGAQALPLLAQTLAGARSSIHIAGWYVTADFGLTRDDEAGRLRDLLGERVERVSVRVLLWAEAPVPLLHRRGRGCGGCAMSNALPPREDRDYRGLRDPGVRAT